MEQSNRGQDPAGDIHAGWYHRGRHCDNRSATVSAAGTLSPDFLEGDAFKEAKSDLLGKFPVSWSVNGSSSTKIENGSLKVDPAETVTELTITATMGDETKTKTVTIAAPTQPESKSVTYGYTTGPKLEVVLSGKYTDDAKYQWYDKDGNEISGATESTYTVETGLSVGTHTYYCKISDKEGDYTTQSESATVTVGKAGLTADMFDFAASTDTTYDGSNKTARVTAKTEYTGVGNNITVKYYKDGDTEGTATAPKDAGTYTVKIDVAEGANYAAASGLTDTEWTFTITPKELTVDMVGTIADQTYTGNALEPAVTVTDGGTLTKDKDYTVSYSDNTNAGTATVTITGIGNYTGTVGTAFTINKATRDKTPEVAINYTEETLSTTAEMEYSTDGTTWTTCTAGMSAIGFGWDGSKIVSEPVELTGKTKAATSSGGSTPTYPPTVEDAENGNVSVSPKNPKQGDTVTVTPTPDDGYEVGDVVVKDSKGNELKVTDNGDGTYSFTQPSGKVTIEVTFVCDGGEGCPSYGFADLDAGAWYHEYVDYVLRSGLMNGYGDGTFRPGDTLSRAMLAQILYNHAGQPKVSGSGAFSDVADDAWYENAVTWAASSGVVLGNGDGRFGPDDPITREQLAVMLYRYEKRSGGGFTGEWMFNLDFTDAADVSDWAYEAICWCSMNGIVEGKGDGILDPKGKATRAEATTMLMRFLELDK